MTEKDISDDALIELALRRQAEDDLYTFVKLAWPYVEPGSPFQGGWALECICQHLEAVYYGDIKRLLINQPPRTGKSTLVSVLYPVWVWIKLSSEKFMCVSYSEKLAVRDNIKARRLIKSRWFQNRWPHITLADDQDTKSYVENTDGGHRYVTGVDGSVTGFGANIIICLPHHSMIKTDIGEIEIGKIVEEKINCKILSWSHEKNAYEYKDIEEYECNAGRELYEIEDENGYVFQCTAEHPVYVDGKGYVPAKDLQEGDVICSAIGQEIKTPSGVGAQ